MSRLKSDNYHTQARRNICSISKVPVRKMDRIKNEKSKICLVRLESPGKPRFFTKGDEHKIPIAAHKERTILT